MTTFTHIYIHGEAGNSALHELAEKAVNLEERRLDLTAELREMSDTLSQIEESQLASVRYQGERLGQIVDGIGEITKRLEAIENRISGSAADPAAP